MASAIGGFSERDHHVRTQRTLNIALTGVIILPEAEGEENAFLRTTDDLLAILMVR